MSHTPEPWQHIWKHDTHKVKRDRTGRMLGDFAMDLDDYNRACECVNALAGIEDPAAILKDIYNALVEIAREGEKIQFYPNDLPEFHARRIQQIARATRQSLGEVYFNTQKVQEPALLEEKL